MIEELLYSKNIKKVVKSGWYRIIICPECEEVLCHDTVYYGGGICNHCGNDSNSTITSNKNVILRKITTKYYGWLTKDSTRYEGKSDADKQWNKNHEQ